MPPPVAPDPRAALEKHMWTAVRTYGHSRIELEWRLGHRQAGFRPGVDVGAWTRLQTVLDGSAAFQKTFTETTERMNNAGVKCIHDCATGAESWMCKKRLADVDVDTDQAWSVRASVSLEESLEKNGDAPAGATADMKYERRKQRWSYAHKCWRVDLTRVRGNLPMHLDEDRDTYEVELELADTGVLFERSLDWVLAWGWRLVDELGGLMAAEPTQTPAPAPAVSWADMA